VSHEDDLESIAQWRYRTEHARADQYQALFDSTPVMVRVVCGKHGGAVATIGDDHNGPMFMARRPWRRFPKFRAQRHNARLLAEFEGMWDLDAHELVFMDAPDWGISPAWCRKGKHWVRLDPAALRAAVADYRRGTGTAVTLVV
jgi:hypothetical protein